jgi:phosphohistidine swiveling domain-containing protein
MMTEPPFNPPGPGSWALETSHCERPRSQYMHGLFSRQQTDGFREGFKRYGALLDTIEYGAVGPFPYGAVRPLGAPPNAHGTPPKWLFKLLLAVHPAIRRRVKRARAVIETKVWREDVKTFWRELPKDETRIAALASERIAELDDASFAEHFERIGAVMSAHVFNHFRNIPVAVVPVGDFLEHVIRWTGASAAEVLAALRGYSPASVAGGRALDDAAAAIANDPVARERLVSGESATTLAALRGLAGPVGQALERLLGRYGDAILSGHDVIDLRVVEMPDVLIATLRARVTAPSTDEDASTESDRAAAKLRARVPDGSRAAFDELLADARAAYPLRDAQVNLDIWALGVTRRTLLEAGRRLARKNKISREDDVFDATHDEILALLGGRSSPIPTEIAARARTRRTSRMEDAPPRLGPEPGAPPPFDWLPADAARIARAVGAYRELMEDSPSWKNGAVVSGVGASPGRRQGTARLVRSAADFGKLRQGDILVAPITTPTYNVILPLLGGVVTDRGGLLSHPAIVSREYGFPSVVGARNATTRIPDGALVEIDGDAGTVRVVTP